MSEQERNQMSPDDVARAIAARWKEYERKNGDTSKAPEPKNEYAPCYDTVGMCSLCKAA